MLSRVAENIYWLARYIERAENTARLINVNTNLLLDLPQIAQPGWEPIINILGSSEHFYEERSDTEERTVLRYLIADKNNSGSIVSSLVAARENARTIRDIIPRESWEAINDLYLYSGEHYLKGVSKRGRHEFMQEIIRGAQAISGLLAGTMLHDDGYQFLRMGRNLERADMTTRIIDVRTANLVENIAGDLAPFETIQWVSVLKSLTAYQMYRRAVQVRVRRSEVVSFLMLDERFPRAFAHCLSEVQSCINNLPRNREPLSTIRKLRKQVIESEPASLEQAKLHKFIDDVQLGLADIHTDIDRTYFHSD